MAKNIKRLTHADMHDLYLTVIRKLKDRPSVILAPVRGGLDMGVKLSHWYKVPLYTVPFQTRDNVESISQLVLPEIPQRYPRMLVVDDICDSGLTLKTIVEAAKIKYKIPIDTAVAVHNVGSYNFYPTVDGMTIDNRPGAEDDGIWIEFPWESWWTNK